MNFYATLASGESVYINYRNVDYLQELGHTVRVHFSNGNQIEIQESLEQLED